MAQPAVEALHHGVVGGLAWPTKVQLDVLLISPFVHHLADEFAAIVRFDGLRLAALGYYLA